MTLDVSEIRDLVREVHEFVQQQRQQDLFAALRTLADELDERTGRLETVVSTLTKTSLRSHSNNTKLRALEPVKSALQQCSALVKDAWDPRALNDTGTLRTLTGTTSELVSELEEAASEAWHAFVNAHPIPRVGQLADLLREMGLPELYRDVLRIRNAINRLEKLARHRFPTLDEFEQFVADMRTAEQGAAHIGLNETVPTDVTQFLQEVAQQGAPLASYTDDVRLWIQQRSLEDSFVIVARSEPTE